MATKFGNVERADYAACVMQKRKAKVRDPDELNLIRRFSLKRLSALALLNDGKMVLSSHSAYHPSLFHPA